MKKPDFDLLATPAQRRARSAQRNASKGKGTGKGKGYSPMPKDGKSQSVACLVSKLGLASSRQTILARHASFAT